MQDVMSGIPTLCIKSLINIRFKKSDTNKCMPETNVVVGSQRLDCAVSSHNFAVLETNDQFKQLLYATVNTLYSIYHQKHVKSKYVSSTEWKKGFLRSTRRRRPALSKGRELNPVKISNDESKRSICPQRQENLSLNELLPLWTTPSLPTPGWWPDFLNHSFV